MFADALKDIPKDSSILEVGTNIGLQLECLKSLGFSHLTGFDIQIEAVRRAKSRIAGIDVLQSSALELPFKDNAFDLVFTSGVLIHIHPDNLKKVMSEMHRVSKKYIMGFEYFSEKLTEIEYRGNKNLLWKADYMRIFRNGFPDLKSLKTRLVKYLANDNTNNLYLLEK
jgi:pseudaminic acid biosynthesis-associated methylase